MNCPGSLGDVLFEYIYIIYTYFGMCSCRTVFLLLKGKDVEKPILVSRSEKIAMDLLLHSEESQA